MATVPREELGMKRSACATSDQVGRRSVPLRALLVLALLGLVASGFADEIGVGDDDTPPLVDEEAEVFSQRWIQPLLFADGFETGDTSRWSAALP
jgi:hypothetical protein